VGVMYWSFRLMVGAGLLMILFAGAGIALVRLHRLALARWFHRLAPWAMVLPIAANLLGWTFAEMGRQPWVVYGLLRTDAAGSPSVGPVSVLVTLLGFTAIYGALAVVDVVLLARFAKAGPDAVEPGHAY
jgi:cytochrome d ubiquinol oxidase subunit I